MQVLKTILGRRNMVANKEPCCMGKLGSGSSSSYRPPSVVTSTEFDDDDVFQAVAQAMLYRQEMDGLCEREAINATLVTSEDKRGFLESLDLRSSNMYANIGDDELDNSGINEILEMTRSTFGATLKLLWRESITGYDSQSSGILSEEDIDSADDNEHRHRLNTPKNLHSPIRRNVLTETCRSDSNASLMPKSSLVADPGSDWISSYRMAESRSNPSNLTGLAYLQLLDTTLLRVPSLPQPPGLVLLEFNNNESKQNT
jgi:hypothetical protein